MASLKTILLTSAIVLAPLAVSAQTFDVVKNTHGHIVKNSFNNCVITKWENSAAACSDDTINQDMLTVYFGFNSSALTPATTQKLDIIAKLILDKKTVQNVDIVGYADVIGRDGYNEKLSQKRAKKVAKYLKSRGIDTANISIQARGSDAPVSDCSGTKGSERKACLWRDRRVEIKLNEVK